MYSVYVQNIQWCEIKLHRGETLLIQCMTTGIMIESTTFLVLAYLLSSHPTIQPAVGQPHTYVMLLPEHEAWNNYKFLGQDQKS